MHIRINRERIRAGQGVVEYVLLLGAVVVGLVVMFVALGQDTRSKVLQTSAGFSTGRTQNQQEDLLHVAGIEMDARTEGPFIRVRATVNVVDQDGAAAKGALVTVAWSTGETAMGRADGQGRARFSYRSQDLENGEVMEVSVETIEASDASYDPDSNAESSETVTLP